MYDYVRHVERLGKDGPMEPDDYVLKDYKNFDREYYDENGVLTRDSDSDSDTEGKVEK
jgi:hypothetical protein